jgi:hypothetical protein
MAGVGQTPGRHRLGRPYEIAAKGRGRSVLKELRQHQCEKSSKRKRRRREVFLAEMHRVVRRDSAGGADHVALSVGGQWMLAASTGGDASDPTAYGSVR